tara:strand:- start:200 stop:313 length:114 start_codon:yes stop_codon:yes gene_type:complete
MIDEDKANGYIAFSLQQKLSFIGEKYGKHELKGNKYC